MSNVMLLGGVGQLGVVGFVGFWKFGLSGILCVLGGVNVAGMRRNCCDGTTVALLLVRHCLGPERSSIACLICGGVGRA